MQVRIVSEGKPIVEAIENGGARIQLGGVEAELDAKDVHHLIAGLKNLSPPPPTEADGKA